MKGLNRATITREPTLGGSLSGVTCQTGESVLYASVPNQAVSSAVTGELGSFSGMEPDRFTLASDAPSAANY
ncbi:unnamed protein product [Tetraodon nigroviridis]|uniref:(spotted green pufferfish) hypothetical protein n=1 Tax=Tetraodon nigroviridis TaxID=99883 RepID=Q4T2Q5_TETNG|nr:unnamed protein product [Tetraodon nigroviridis]